VRAARAERAARVEALLVDIDEAVAALKRELRLKTRDMPKGGSR
jgi:hypothetical protein